MAVRHVALKKRRYPAQTETEARIQLAALEHDHIHRWIEASTYYTERRRLIRLTLGGAGGSGDAVREISHDPFDIHWWNNMEHALPIGPAVPGKAQAGPPRGSDASQCSDRSRVPLSIPYALPDELDTELKALLAAVRAETIEDCARIAGRYADGMGMAFTPRAMARDIERDIRGLAVPARHRDQADFPPWAFV